MKGIEYEHKKTQKCTEKYLDYTIRTRVGIKKLTPETVGSHGFRGFFMGLECEVSALII